MVLEIIGIMLAVIILSIIINGIEDYCKQSKRVNMSFKEAMDLVELPVVTFYNGNKKLNFIGHWEQYLSNQQLYSSSS